MAEWGVGKAKEYHTVAILGGQSSGKSTLLNRVFKTGFAEMDSATGIRQTTQGMWMSHSHVAGSTVLVLDVEGSDSLERGEHYRVCARIFQSIGE